MTDRPYHHGDLREALVTAGYEVARARGPQALGVRELAKAVGVSPAAAYRHFADLDHLVAAVSQRAREQLAQEMLAALDPLPSATAARAAWDRLEAIGRAYVAFGAAEPQLFETAFTPCAPTNRPDDPAAWDVLVSALDDLAALGEIDGDRRLPDAMVAWSSVHGLGTLLSRGLVPAEASEPATQAVLDGVQAALRA
jgi:AcrR family transcriptional regulator